MPHVFCVKPVVCIKGQGGSVRAATLGSKEPLFVFVARSFHFGQPSYRFERLHKYTFQYISICFALKGAKIALAYSNQNRSLKKNIS